MKGTGSFATAEQNEQMAAIRKRCREILDEQALLWLRREAAKLSHKDANHALKALERLAIEMFGGGKYPRGDTDAIQNSVAALQVKLLAAGFGAIPAPGIDSGPISAPNFCAGGNADLPNPKRRR